MTKSDAKDLAHRALKRPSDLTCPRCHQLLLPASGAQHVDTYRALVAHLLTQH